MESRRLGLSLLELLVVIAILGTILGLLLPAIQQVRESAARSQSENNLRQIALACHHFASANGNMVPVDLYLGSSHRSYLSQILEYCEQQYAGRNAKLFLSPADPTLPNQFGHDALCSYAGNAIIFDERLHHRLPQSFTDGTSNTILFAEHYSQCDQAVFSYLTALMMSPVTQRPIFAAAVGPVTTGNPPVASATLFDGMSPQTTFQTRPCSVVRDSNGTLTGITPPECGSRPRCNHYLAQTPHAGGMLTALADGSVRVLHPNISPATYWGAITPAGGEILADW